MGLSPAGASSANISRSYGVKDVIASGSLVSLDPSHPNFVVPANTSNGQQLLGVVVAANDSLLAVGATTDTGMVQVATSGTVSALVSSINGPINVGDQISVSPFNGVGMKATSSSTQIIGLAQTAFSNSTAGGAPEKVTDKNGNTTDIRVGYISIAIGSGSASGNLSQLNFLQRLAKTLTGHTVSTTRALISFVVAIVSSLAIVVLIYASIYGSIISVGRNPLAKYAVFRSLAAVLGMAALIAAVASVTIFLLLQ